MTIKHIDLTRVGTFRVLADFFASFGTPIDGPLRKYGLPDLHLLEDDSSYLPMANCQLVLHEMARSEGVDDLLLRAMTRNGLPLYPLKPQASLLLTLWEGLPLFKHVHPSKDFFVTLHGDAARICVSSLTNHNSQRLSLFDWGFMLQTITLIRRVTNEAWVPGRIGIQGGPVIPDFSRDYFSETRFISHQKSYWVEVPMAILSRPLSELELPGPGMKNSSQIDWRLKQLLRSYLREDDLGLTKLCDITGSSRRTIQRNLALEGLDYRKMLLEVRYEVACEMLRQPELKMMEISELLGYSNPAHFSRAFRRIGGVSPSQYRSSAI